WFRRHRRRSNHARSALSVCRCLAATRGCARGSAPRRRQLRIFVVRTRSRSAPTVPRRPALAILLDLLAENRSAPGSCHRLRKQYHGGRERPFHFAAIRPRTASTTWATGISTRQSLTLLFAQPSSTHGRHECVDTTTRARTCHGPHSSSPLGPKST